MSIIRAMESMQGFDDSLNMTQHLAEDEHRQQLGEYDVLHEEVKDKLQAEKETELEAPTEEASPASDEAPMPETAPGEVEEGAEDDTVAAGDDTEDESEESLKTVDGKRTTVAAESLRNEYYERTVVEAFDMEGVKSVGRGIGSAAVVVGDLALKGIIGAAGILAQIGMKYGPTVFSALKTGVVYLFLRSVKALLKTTISAFDAAKRSYRSFSKHKSAIAKLRETLDVLKKEGKTLDTSSSFIDKQALNWFAVNRKPGVLASAQAMKVFLTETVKHIDESIMHDTKTVKRLIDLSATGVRGDVTSYLNVSSFSGQYLKKNVKGHEVDPELVDNYVYGTVLPDNILFVANLPKRGLMDMEAITKAYRASGVFLTVDPSFSMGIDKVDYMDIEGLSRFLDVLEGICDQGLAHIDFYKRVRKESEALKFGYRHYYQRLAASEDKVSVQDSLVEYVYLKQFFINKVYLPGAMDIHDYAAAYLTRALRYVKSNLKQVNSKD